MEQSSPWNLGRKRVFYIIAVNGFLLYGNTLLHEFALDDMVVYTENEFTQKGLAGIWDHLTNDHFRGYFGEEKELVSGGRYRPLSLVIHSLQFELVGNRPLFAHFFSILCYILSGFLLYLLLDKLRPPASQTSSIVPFALIVTLLWFFHPVHTEVVANIKGLDEILALCFVLLASLKVLDFLENRSNLSLVGIGVFFFLGMLSKESAVTWLALVPLMVFFFTSYSLRQALPAYLALVTSFTVWFALRHGVVGSSVAGVADNVMNDPFLGASSAEKHATIFLTLGKYLQLLVWPHPLTFDYYPWHIALVDWDHPGVIFSVVLYGVLVIFAVRGFLKKQMWSFAVLFFLAAISITSNIVFSVGVFMGERFLFVPSISFAIATTLVFTTLMPRWVKRHATRRNMTLIALGAVLLVYSVLTIRRNAVWRNNLTLATHDADIRPYGAKSNTMAGGALIEEASKPENEAMRSRMLQRATEHLQRAISSYPEYIDALLLMGNAQWNYTNDARQSLPYYLEVLQINPEHSSAWNNIVYVLDNSDDADYKIAVSKRLLVYDPPRLSLYLFLGRTYGQQKNDLVNARLFLEKGRALFPEEPELLSNLGTVYALQNENEKAIEVLEVARSVNPNDAVVLQNLGLLYYSIGQMEQAKACFDGAVSLQPSLDRSQFPI